MSFILDALRKADAERERGAVPGVHAQPTYAGGAAPGRTRPGAMPWLGAGAAALASLVFAAMAWYVFSNRSSGARGSAEPGSVAAVPMAPIAQMAPMTPTPPTPAVRPIEPAPAVAARPTETAAPAAPVTPAPTALPATRSESPTRPALAPARAGPPVAGAAPKAITDAAGRPLPPPAPKAEARPADTATTAPTAAAPGASATPPLAAASSRIYATGELPDEIRRQLPALSVGGSMYSPTPANRIVIVGGQVFHEGDRITPDLVLHQIRQKSAVLGFKGYRYELTY